MATNPLKFDSAAKPGKSVGKRKQRVPVNAPTQVNIYEAKTHLSSLLQRAANGEEIIVARAGKPLARIVSMAPAPDPMKRRVFGQNFLGITYMAPDWDAPMGEEDLADWGA